MNFKTTPEQDSLRQLAAKIFTDLCDELPRAGGGRVPREAAARRREEAEKGGWIHRPLWRELAASGLVGAALPVEHGGAGLGMVELCLVLVELGRQAAPVPLWPTVCLAALPIARFGTAEQQRRHLPPVAAGELILTAALAEPDGGDPAQPATRAVPEGAGWRLSGEKTAVRASHLAGRILVPARGPEGVTVFLVDPHAPGLGRERQVATTGEPLERLLLDGVRVERGDVLGEPGAGAAVVAWTVQRALVGLCAIEAGVAARQLEMTAEYTTRRHQFERPIASFQAVGQRAADAYIDVEAIRLSMWQAAWRLDAGKDAAREVAVAKFWAAEGGQRVAVTAQHLHGGMGFDRAYPLHRYFLLAKQIELELGGASQQLAHLGAALAAES